MRVPPLLLLLLLTPELARADEPVVFATPSLTLLFGAG